MATDSANYYMLVNECVWSKSRDCLLRPEVDMAAVLESELGQKWAMPFNKVTPPWMIFQCLSQGVLTC